ncbi:MAG: type II toxin-antitoxin system HicB family antitoxin [Chloroflexi bacterium]|nr:type II toxin-antitoxin system HicB family antitoxin [Chloroflexota bacterium]
MTDTEFYEFRVVLSRDAETGHIVAEVPALDIADYGADAEEALQHIQEMLAFHLECLFEEGQPIPTEPSNEEGLYLRVRVPARAA